MKELEMEPTCSNSDNEIWEYKSQVSQTNSSLITKRKMKEESSANTSGIVSQKKQRKQQSKVEDNEHPSESKNIPQTLTITTTKHEGFCPLCQLPFGVLTIQTPQWHVSECIMRSSPSDRTECPSGKSCTSTFPSHYMKYTHHLIAMSRDTPSAKIEPDMIQDNSEKKTSARCLNTAFNTELPIPSTATDPDNTDVCFNMATNNIPDYNSDQDMFDDSIEISQDILGGSEDTKQDGDGKNCLSPIQSSTVEHILDQQSSTTGTEKRTATETSTYVSSLFLKNTTSVNEKLLTVDSMTKKSLPSCPFYKRIPGTPFTVDAFKYGDIPDCKAYFLSHFHYDHYMGLSKHFRHPIYCSKVTGNLIVKKIGVDASILHTIALDEPCVIDGATVTFMEANHCPGAVLILFQLKNGHCYLHTGDFRASQAMESYRYLKNVKVKQLYLDTTYCDPKYTFPSQEDILLRMIDVVMTTMGKEPDTLIVCGSYTIGKERVFLAIGEALKCKVCVSHEKKTVLECLDDPSITSLLTLDGRCTNLHVLPMSQLSHAKLAAYLDKWDQYNSVLAFEPTGWMYSNKALERIKPKLTKGNITIYGIPYSEHSSYDEMKRFVQFICPDTIVPTVNNGSPGSRHKMETWFKSWRDVVTKPTPKQTKLDHFIKKRC